MWGHPTSGLEGKPAAGERCWLVSTPLEAAFAHPGRCRRDQALGNGERIRPRIRRGVSP